MLRLANSTLRVDLLDPADDDARRGPRYCRGGYIWQVHDTAKGPLVSGPEYPHPDPTPFNGQGLPESLRHRTRDGRPLTWRGSEGLGIGIGRLVAGAGNEVKVEEPCTWAVSGDSTQLVFQTRQEAAGFACELSRKVELRDRAVISATQLTNVGTTALNLQWFAHPFWALSEGRARVSLPAGSTLPDNPGFAVDAAGVLTFRRPFVTPKDDQFALLTLPSRSPLTVAIDHPVLPGVSFSTDFVPDECPVWANARTVSVEPYLYLAIPPGETRHWSVEHRFLPA